MNGLALCERFYLTHGPSLISAVPSQYRDRIAAGFVGPGSDCLGYDDDLSRDHDWGPAFCLWIMDEDYPQIFTPLQVAYTELPKIFEGHERNTSSWGGGRDGVFSVSGFYRRYIGNLTRDSNLLDWLHIPETSFSECTSGKVFHDPVGAFTAIRKDLMAFYPEDVRLKKIAARCMAAGQSGQYNYQRSAMRGDAFAIQYAEIKFCNEVLALVYLLKKKYSPYYKWMLRGISSLGDLGKQVHFAISHLLHERNPHKKMQAMHHLTALIIDELVASGLSSVSSPFFLDHGPSVHSKIIDLQLANMDIWHY